MTTVKVTAVEFEWREWRLGEGRYRGRGPASKPRPAKFPATIPAAWWARLNMFLAKRSKPPAVPPSSGTPAPFDGHGLVLLEPTGGTEDIAKAAAAGFTYLLLNTAYIHGGDWSTHRARATQFGLKVGPWQRVLGPDQSRVVEETAAAWGSSFCAHNLEVEAATTYPPANLAAYVEQNWGDAKRARAVISEPWMQPIDWHPLSTRGWVGIPEAFLNADARFLPADLVNHVHSLGFEESVPMMGWGVWGDASFEIPPSAYLRLWPGPFVVYPGDDKEARYVEWRR